MISEAMLLAQADASPLQVANETVSRLDILNHPQELLTALSNLHVVWASIFVVVGALCILNGYRWHKKVVIVCAFLGGLGLGHLLSKQMGNSRIVMGTLGLLCAIVAAPLLRFAVAIFGALTGAFIGANVWTAFSESPDAHLAGAAMGSIALGLASFIMFRLVVVMFTSIGGAAMAVFGGITLLLHVPAWSASVQTSLTANQLLLPLIVTVAAVTGFVFQHSRMREDSTRDESEAAAT
ncbi:MAG: hypothetical protein V3T84_02560 [Phycisphaerales bacterium]